MTPCVALRLTTAESYRIRPSSNNGANFRRHLGSEESAECIVSDLARKNKIRGCLELACYFDLWCLHGFHAVPFSPYLKFLCLFYFFRILPFSYLFYVRLIWLLSNRRQPTWILSWYWHSSDLMSTRVPLPLSVRTTFLDSRTPLQVNTPWTCFPDGRRACLDYLHRGWLPVHLEGRSLARMRRPGVPGYLDMSNLDWYFQGPATAEFQGMKYLDFFRRYYLITEDIDWAHG